MSKTYHRSPLTATQEKLLLAKLEKARPKYYNAPEPPKPKRIIAAESLVREYERKRSIDRHNKGVAESNAYAAVREAVIFAETKEAALKAVSDYLAKIGKESQ